MPAVLDSQQLEKIDRENMRDLIAGFSGQLSNTHSVMNGFAENLIRPADIREIVFSGVGASAIAGDFIRSYLSNHLSIPMMVNRSYRLPFFVGTQTLVVLVSYSGDTEECLYALREAREKQAQCIGITSGGKLEKECQKHQIPFVTIPGGISPRASLGYIIMAIFQVLEKIGILDKTYQTESSEAAACLDRLSKNVYGISVPENQNVAKRLAFQCLNKTPVLYAAVDYLDVVALRWRYQFEENAKTLAFHHVLPEMNHNELIAWQNKKAAGEFIVFLLRDRGDHERIQKRMDRTRDILKNYGHEVIEVFSEGKGLLARMMSLIHLGDWVSFYLAILKEVDPTPIPVIQTMKSDLAKDR